MLVMNFNIRQAHLSELPHFYRICLKTGGSGGDATDLFCDEYILGQYFAAPYLHFEIDSCFVLELDNMPVGYVIGTSDTLKFNEWMNTDWLLEIRKQYKSDMEPRSDLEKWLLEIIHRDCRINEFNKAYPSHLHIDLLPVAQKKGFGKKMISRFVEHLVEQGSPGVQLSVGEANNNAIGFYTKLGFIELAREEGEVVMGMNLS